MLVVPVKTVTDFEFADAPGAHHFAGEAEFAAGALLAADLKNAGVAVDGVDQVFGFADGEGERLFAVDILAGGAGGGGEQAVPVIGRGDEDGVDFLAVQEVVIVVIIFDVCGTGGGAAPLSVEGGGAVLRGPGAVGIGVGLGRVWSAGARLPPVAFSMRSRAASRRSSCTSQMPRMLMSRAADQAPR